ncbi:hypothetical protein SD80_014865 [Scytonema tolypothrichoides VB-61278]|nr:hypothetical protein SD80_014865 [Scytonema tolypothrichoides VB-61278]
MKASLISFSVSLVVLGVGLLTKIQSTPAQPATVFQPILSDIRQQLPQGTEIRLPSTLPTFNRSLLSKAFSDFPVDGNIYPYVDSKNEAIAVNFGVIPNCANSAKPDQCTIGGIGVFKSGKSKFWPPKGENITPVDLGNGIRGFYLTRGSGHNTLRYVFWKQNGLEFALGTAAFAMSQQQIIETAISAANEPAITSAN